MLKIKSLGKLKIILLITILIVNVISVFLSLIFKNNDLSVIIEVIFALLILFAINYSSNDIGKKKAKAENKNDQKEIDHCIEIHKALWFMLFIHIFILLVVQILLNSI